MIYRNKIFFSINIFELFSFSLYEVWYTRDLLINVSSFYLTIFILRQDPLILWNTQQASIWVVEACFCVSYFYRRGTLHAWRRECNLHFLITNFLKCWELHHWNHVMKIGCYFLRNQKELDSFLTIYVSYIWLGYI